MEVKKFILGIDCFGINDAIYVKKLSTLDNQEQKEHLAFAVNSRSKFKNLEKIKDFAAQDQDFKLNTVIEDKANGLFLYDSQAKEQRTGSGIFEELTPSTDLLKLPVSILWQQLHTKKDLEQEKVAIVLRKYIVAFILEKLKQNPDFAPFVKTEYDLKRDFYLVLIIPDNLAEREQQCLLNAFSLYDIKLLWRSVAFLMNVLFNPSLNQKFLANRKGQAAYENLGVLYFGVDDFCYSEYELRQSKEDNQEFYIVRKYPVYAHCSLGYSYFDFAYSYAQRASEQIIGGYDCPNQLNVILQMLYSCPDIWGKEQVNTPVSLWLKSKQSELWYLWNPNNSKSLFDLRFDFENQSYSLLYSKLGLQRKETISSVYDLVKQVDQQVSAGTKVFLAGAMSKSKHLSPLISLFENKVDTIEQSGAEGATIFLDRLLQDKVTYLDRLRSFALLVSKDEEYNVVKLIDSNDVVKPSQIVEKTYDQIFSIDNTSSNLELYISQDDRFNEQSVKEATTHSFASLGIEVYHSSIELEEKLEKPEHVKLAVKQAPLSGLTKLIIKPNNPDDTALDPHGYSVNFDLSNTKMNQIFTDCLEQVSFSFPPYMAYRLDKVVKNWRATMCGECLEAIQVYNGETLNPYINPEEFNACIQSKLELFSGFQPSQCTSTNINCKLKNYLEQFEKIPKYNLPVLQPIANNLRAYIKEVRKYANAKKSFVGDLFVCYSTMVSQDAESVLGFFNLLQNYKDVVSVYRQTISTYYLIRSHPKLFNPSLPSFVLDKSLANILLQISKNGITDSLNEFYENIPNLDKSIQIIKEHYQKFSTIPLPKEYLKLSFTKSATIYSLLSLILHVLMYRKRDKRFLAKGSPDYTDLKQKLDYIKQVAGCLFDKSVNILSHSLLRIPANESVRKKIESYSIRVNKLIKHLDGVLDYLDRKGNNANILIQIDSDRGKEQ